MKKPLLAILFIISLGLQTAWAIDLGTAKSQGLVGETPQGYLAAVGNPSGEIKNLINGVNAQRKAHYTNIANQNGQPLQTVEKLAGQTAIEKTAKGNYVKVNGAWRKK